MLLATESSRRERRERRFSMDVDFTRKIVETYGARIMSMAMGLATTVIVSRSLGPKGRGLFAVATAIGAIGVQIGNFGLHASNTYFVAKDRELMAPLVANTLVISLTVGCFGALISWVVFFIRPDIAPLEGMLLLLALLWIPLGLVYTLLQNLLLGIGHVRTYNVIEVLSKAATLILLGLSLLLKRRTAEAMFTVMIVSLSGSAVSVLLWLLRATARPVRPSVAVFRETLRVGLKAYFIALFGFLVLRVDLLVVKYIAGAQQAGYYSISETMAENILALPVTVGILLFPKLSGMTHNKEKLYLTGKASLLTAVLMLPIVILAPVFAAPLIRLFFGAAFMAATRPFIWLMPGAFFLGIEIVMVQYLNSLGFPTSIVYIWPLMTLLNIGANVWVIPVYGITGSAIVSTVCYFLVFAAVLLLILRRLPRSGLHTRIELVAAAMDGVTARES